jgi:hypothetical protein
MATVATTGDISIDMADVWTFVFKELPGLPDQPGVIDFSVDDDALTVRLGDRIDYIDAAVLWTWILDEHFPKGMSDFENFFGVPRVVGDDMKVNFASSNYGNPRNWVDRPACLDEWTLARKT